MNKYYTTPAGYTILNGISNHDIRIFGINQVHRTRNGKYILNSTDSMPQYVIPPANGSLGAFISSSEAAFPLDSDLIAAPEPFEGANIQFPSIACDEIVVSRRYAELAARTFNIPPDFLDRLVVPVPVYSAENSDEKIPGCAFLRKYLPPLDPPSYTRLIAQSQTGTTCFPSRMGMRACLLLWRNPAMQCFLPPSYWENLNMIENSLR